METKKDRIRDLRTAIILGYDALEMAINADDWDAVDEIAYRLGQNMAEFDELSED